MLQAPDIQDKIPKYIDGRSMQRPQYLRVLPPAGKDTVDLSAEKKKDGNENLIKTGIIASVVASLTALGISIALMCRKAPEAAAKKVENVTEAVTKGVQKASKQAESQGKDSIKSMEEELLKESNVKFEDLSNEKTIDQMALPKKLKDCLNEVKITISHFWEVIRRGGRGIKGILLYGPPGTGKSTFSKALAKMFPDSLFANLETDQMQSCYNGMSEKIIRRMVDQICEKADKMYAEYLEKLSKVIGSEVVNSKDKVKIAQAVEKATQEGKKIPEMPRIFVFLDEIDTIMMKDTGINGKNSNDLLNVYKKALEDGFAKRDNIVVIGATNFEIDPKLAKLNGKELDSAMLSRFEKKIEVGTPTKDQQAVALEDTYKILGNRAVPELQDQNTPYVKVISKFLEDHNAAFRETKAVVNSAAMNLSPNAQGEIPQGQPVTVDDIIDAIEKHMDSFPKPATTAEIQTLRQDIAKIRQTN